MSTVVELSGRWPLLMRDPDMPNTTWVTKGVCRTSGRRLAPDAAIAFYAERAFFATYISSSARASSSSTVLVSSAGTAISPMLVDTW